MEQGAILVQAVQSSTSRYQERDATSPLMSHVRSDQISIMLGDVRTILWSSPVAQSGEEQKWAIANSPPDE